MRFRTKETYKEIQIIFLSFGKGRDSSQRFSFYYFLPKQNLIQMQGGDNEPKEEKRKLGENPSGLENLICSSSPHFNFLSLRLSSASYSSSWRALTQTAMILQSFFQLSNKTRLRLVYSTVLISTFNGGYIILLYLVMIGVCNCPAEKCSYK